jgi:hypothetical protein
LPPPKPWGGAGKEEEEPAVLITSPPLELMRSNARSIAAAADADAAPEAVPT